MPTQPQPDHVELKRSISKLHERMDAMGRETLQGIGDIVAEVRVIASKMENSDNRLEKHESRIGVLEISDARHAAEKGVIAAILKSPLIVGLIALVASAVAVIKAWGDG